MPDCIVRSHALWKLVQNGKVAGPDEAHAMDGGDGGTDRSSSCSTASFLFCEVVASLSIPEVLS